VPRLLLIHHDRVLQEAAHTFLSREGFEILSAPGGFEAILLARRILIDLMIAPLRLREMTGPELCARLREGGAASPPPVVLTGAEAERERALEAGAGAFVAEPYALRDLLGAIRKLIPIQERSSGRAPISLPVVCGEGPGSYVAFTRDISASGLFLRGKAPVPRGSTLRLRLRLPGEPSRSEIALSAEVVRLVEPGADPGQLGFGVRFLDFPLLRRVPITRFVREHAAD
jgi:CheY-like chemotaxis protein